VKKKSGGREVGKSNRGGEANQIYMYENVTTKLLCTINKHRLVNIDLIRKEKSSSNEYM
jgi:hypothetical protein